MTRYRVFIAVFALAGAFLGGTVGYLLAPHSHRYQASANVVLLPPSDLALSEAASFWLAVTRGQITRSAAVIFEDPRWLPSASSAAEVPQNQLTLTAYALPETTMLTVTMAADSPAAAESALNDVLTTASPEVSSLVVPLAVKAQWPQKGSAAPLPVPSRKQVAAAGVLGGLLVGAGLGWLAQRRRRQPSVSGHSAHLTGKGVDNEDPPQPCLLDSIRVAVTPDEIAGMALAAGVATLAGIATLGANRPLLLVAAPVAGVGLIFAARRPLVALVVMVVVEITNMGAVVSPSGGIPIFKASLLLGVLAVGLALRDPEARKRLNAWTWISIGLLALYFVTQAVATVGSADVAQSIAGMRPIALDCFFMVLVLVLIQLTARPWTVAAALVIPFAVLSLLTVINQFGFGGTMTFGGFSTVTTATGELVTTLRHGGPLPDSNFWGRDLVMGLPLAAALLTRALRGRPRWIVVGWVFAIIAQLAGIYLTQSRGTFLCAALAIAVWFIASERSVRRWGLAALPLALMAFLVPGVGNRLTAALADLTEGQNNANVDPSLLGRIGAQQQAWMMFQERPYFGFGPATFSGQIIEFAGRVSVAVREPAGAPHNIYLELLAESGVTGLVGLVLVILGFLTVAWLRIVAEPRAPERVLAAAVCAAIIGWSLASILLHMAYFRTFTVVLALAVGIAPAWPVPGEVVRIFLRRVGVWSAAGIIGLSASGLCLYATSASDVHATQRMTLLPVGPLDGWYAYALDIRSRIELLPTFAQLLHDKASPVDVEDDVVRGLLRFTVTADSADMARDQIQLALAHAGTMLNESIGYNQYELAAVGSMRVSVVQKRSQLASIGSGLVGVGAALVAGWVLSRAPRGRRA